VIARILHNQNAFKRVAMLVLTMLCIGISSFSVAAAQESVLPPLENAVVLNSGWEYRWGDSPQRSGKAPDWALLDEPGAWKRAAGVPQVAVPKGHNVMWLRVRLPQGKWAAPSLLIENSSAKYQVYMGGRLLYPSDSLDLNSRYITNVLRWHVVPLLSVGTDGFVYFRVVKPGSKEPIGRVSLGARHAHYKTIVNGSVWRISLGLLTLLVGGAGIFVAAFRKFQPLSLSFGAMSLLAGLFVFLGAPFRLEWVNAPFAWSFFEYEALFLVPPLFYLFLKEVLGEKESRIVRLCARAHFVFAGVAAFMALTGAVSYQTILLLFFVLCVATTAVVSKALWKSVSEGFLEQKLTWATGVFTLAAAFWEILSWKLSAGGVSSWPGVFVVALTAMVLSAAYVILRNAMRTERNLHRVNGLLERSVGMAVELSGAGELVSALSKTAEAMVRELRVRAVCNVSVYVRQEVKVPEAPLFQQAILVSQGRLVHRPEFSPLRQRFEAKATQFSLAARPYVTPKKMLIVPILVDERKWGFFTVDNYENLEPHSDDLILLRVLCETLSHTILSLELRDQFVVDAKMESEIQITSALQKFLIPDSVQVPFAQVASQYRAATQTGGDWFGYHVHANKKRVDLFLGDATGHGMKPALMVAHASGALQALLSRYAESEASSDEDRLVRLARMLNKVIYDLGREELYMAMIFMSIDLETGVVSYVNAGNPPFYCVSAQTGRAQSVVPAPSQSLGFSRSPVFHVEAHTLQVGDVLFLSSSGLFDNEGEDGRRLSSRRLKTILEKGKEPQDIQNLVSAAADGVWKDSPLRDDVTTLVFKWLGTTRITQDAPISRVDKKVI
jgi:serine phosphatase RsbU (regulator of sigma subunit)